MPSITHILAIRRRLHDRSRRLSRIAVMGIALLTIATLLIGVMAVAAALTFADLASDLPDEGELESFFEFSLEEDFPVTQVFDRTGQIVIKELMNPLAQERVWMNSAAERAWTLPEEVIAATLAIQDVSFWSNPGYDLKEVLRASLAQVLGESELVVEPTITQRLVESILLSPQDRTRSDFSRYIRSALLASRVTEKYSKDQLLEWYLNSAYYGNLAYGIDSAALVYLGKHATDLSLAESALLAGIPLDPKRNPIASPLQTRIQQVQTLLAMVEGGWLDSSRVAQAVEETVRVRSEDEIHQAMAGSAYERLVWFELNDLLGPNFSLRPGLKIVTSLDFDLQMQVECTAATHKARMQGASASFAQPASDGTPCLGAGLLPPMRPSDIGVDHKMDEIAVIVIDAVRGEVLALVDDLDEPAWGGEVILAAHLPRSGGSALMPFIYLTAYSRGFSPGSMVLDVPTEFTGGGEVEAIVVENTGGVYHGPVRMRTALAGSFNAAAVRVLVLSGVENVLRTSHAMGINTLDDPGVDYGPVLALGSGEVTLSDLAYSHAVLANEGRMVGREVTAERERPGFRELDPVTILRIEDLFGRKVYEYLPAEKPVLSPQLAFLINDVLADDSARWQEYGQPNPFEIGRPAAVKIGLTGDRRDQWVTGYTPSRVVAVWAGNPDSQAALEVGILTGAVPVWHALMRYASSELPLQGWSIPPGVSQIEVCDPSGLLPLEYCPQVVKEFFLDGSEPISYDNLFQPFKVNRETGKLATLFTPMELVEEKVFMIPPPEAAEWAESAGMERPPLEYDSFYNQDEFDPRVNINSPTAFSYLRGLVRVRGDSRPEGFSYYRLQYGQGLNPTLWIQIGTDDDSKVVGGTLGNWDTAGLQGLFTLQLIAVLEDGKVKTAAVPVTVDNLAPTVRLVSPIDGQVFSLSGDRSEVIQAQAGDETSLARVEFYVNGKRIGATERSPFSIRWDFEEQGKNTVFVRAYDEAGNLAESEQRTIQILP